MGDEGIRSYGPGKFATILDSHAYRVSGDGGTDEEASYPDGGGWFGIVWINDAVRDAFAEEAANENETLTKEEDALLDESVAVIFYERSDGIVEVTWYDNKREAEEEWAQVLVDTEGDEDEEEEGEDEEEESD